MVLPRQNVNNQQHPFSDPIIRRLAIVHVILLLVFVFFRLMDGDEGIFLRAGQLVHLGQIPYHDFFYMQMPYLPYLLSHFSTMGYGGLIVCRLLAAGASFGLAYSILMVVARLGTDKNIPRLFYGFIIFNGLFLSWQTTVKTQVFSDYFGIVSFLFLTRILNSAKVFQNRVFQFLAAGFFAGLALNIRLVHVLLLLSELVLVWIFLPGISKKFQSTLIILVGVMISSIGSLILFFSDPSLFWLHNVSLHNLWGSEIVVQSGLTRLMTTAKFFLYPQTLILMVPVFIGVRVALRTPVREWSNLVRLSMSALLVSILFSTFYSLIIRPVQFQYFEQVVPYLVLAGLAGWEGLTKTTFWMRWRLLILGVYILGIIPFLLIFLFNLRENDASNNLKMIRETSQIINQTTAFGDTILSGNTFLPQFAGRAIVRGMEVDGRQLLKILTPDQKEKVHLMDSLEFVNRAMSGHYKIVVYDTTQFSELSHSLPVQYELITAPNSIRVWKKRNLDTTR